VVGWNITSLGHGENGLVDVGIEFLSKGLELHYMEAFEALVHNVRGHVHTKHNVGQVLLQDLHFMSVLDVDLLDVLTGELKVVADVEEVLGKLGNRILSRGIDFLLVSLDCVVILC